MKAVLINSPVEKIVEEYDAPPYPHIGLGYLATYANRHGILCDVIDAKLERIDLKSLLNRLERYRGEEGLVFGFTAMTHEISRIAHTAEEVKKAFPKAFFVLGGVHITALPEQTLDVFKVFDAGIIGEGERSFVKLVERHRAGSSLQDIDGIAFKEGGCIVHNRKTEWITNLDEVGYPDWSLFPKAMEYPINIGRGCPIPCVFCMRASGTKSRFRSLENIVEELDMLERLYSPGYVHFFTDDFGYSKDLTNRLLDTMIEKKYAFKWRAGMRVTNISVELLKKMKAAGCDHFEVGIESGNKEILKAIRKGITLDQAEQTVKMAKEAGLDCWCYFILGHPNETWKTAMDTINFLCRINPKNAAIGIMVPYPGTEVWEMAKKGEGGYRLLSTDWKDFNKQIGNALELKDLSRKQLEFLQIYGYIKLFLVNLRLMEFAGFCWQYKKEGWGFLKNFIPKLLKLK